MSQLYGSENYNVNVKVDNVMGTYAPYVDDIVETMGGFHTMVSRIVNNCSKALRCGEWFS